MFSYFSYMCYLACNSFDYTKLMLSVFLFHIFAAQNDNNDGSIRKYTRKMYRDMYTRIQKETTFIFKYRSSNCVFDYLLSPHVFCNHHYTNIHSWLVTSMELKYFIISEIKT